MTPAKTLHDAARKGDLKLAERLIAEGADVYARDAAKRTPIDVARRQIVDFLLRLPDKDALHVLAAHRRPPYPFAGRMEAGWFAVERLLAGVMHIQSIVDANVHSISELAAWTAASAQAPSPKPRRIPKPQSPDASGSTAGIRVKPGETDMARAAPPEPAQRDMTMTISPLRASPRIFKQAAGLTLDTGRPTPRGHYRFWQRWRRDDVDCSVFCPPEVPAGDAIMVQVHVHKEGESEKAARAAREADAEASRRGTVALGTSIRRGSRLTFELAMPGMEIAEPVLDLTWRGQGADAVQFIAHAPIGLAQGAVFGTVYVSQDSAPIGQVSFKVKVLAPHTHPAEDGDVGARPHRYTSAFISYASADRREVLKRVSMLTAVGVKCIQDVLSLEPGDEWLPRIYQWIDSSDVFLLFWSSHAKKSAWVEKEWRHAMKAPARHPIRPVIIEGPPIPEPPPELAHLHFSDRVRYFLAGAQ